MVNELNENYLALEIGNFSNHEMQPEIYNYLIAGFPENEILKLEDNTLLIKPLVSNLTSCKRNVYDYYGLDDNKFHILNFRGKVRTSKSKVILNIDTKKPYGLSGGGIWFYLIEENIETKRLSIEYFLIGIMIEFRSGKYQCLIGSKIQNLIDLISTGENIKFGITPI